MPLFLFSRSSDRLLTSPLPAEAGRGGTGSRAPWFPRSCGTLALGTGLIALALGLASCKILPTAKATAARPGGVDTFFNNTSFDPDKMVADMWDTKVIPYLEGKAGPFVEVRDLARHDADAAGRKYGYRGKGDEAPWIAVVRIEGTIVAAETASRAATIDVDVDGDGKADATVQIGPAFRGTALRDSLDFVSFNNFTNQIDFAKFGKAFNTYVDKRQLQALPRDKLVGAKVEILGVMALEKLEQPPLVTPARLSLTPKS